MEDNYKTYTKDNSEFFTIPSNIAKDKICILRLSSLLIKVSILTQ